MKGFRAMKKKETKNITRFSQTDHKEKTFECQFLFDPPSGADLVNTALRLNLIEGSVSI